jgi:glutaredoxin
VKEFLSRAGVPFTAHNVDEDDKAYDDLVARGYRTVPMTIFEDRVVKGFDVPALEQAIDAWRSRH